jgi:hypothetical protein
MYHDLSIWHTYMREHVYAFIKTISNQCFTIDIHIVLKPGSTRRVDPGQVDEKIGKVMIRCDPATRLTQQNPVATC